MLVEARDTQAPTQSSMQMDEGFLFKFSVRSSACGRLVSNVRKKKKQPTNPRVRYGTLSPNLVYGLDPVCLIMGEVCDTLRSMIMIATRYDAEAWETLISRQTQYIKASTRSAAINLFRRSVMRAVRRPRVIRQMCLKLDGPNQLRAQSSRALTNSGPHFEVFFIVCTQRAPCAPFTHTFIRTREISSVVPTKVLGHSYNHTIGLIGK